MLYMLWPAHLEPVPDMQGLLYIWYDLRIWSQFQMCKGHYIWYKDTTSVSFNPTSHCVYSSNLGNTMLVQSCLSFVSVNRHIAFLLDLTLDNAVYNWPWAKGSVWMSSMVHASVKPWQPLKVVAYASCKGNCFWFTFHNEQYEWNIKLMWGMQWLSKLLLSRTMNLCISWTFMPSPNPRV
jgi:hypothetical protein